MNLSDSKLNKKLKPLPLGLSNWDGIDGGNQRMEIQKAFDLSYHKHTKTNKKYLLAAFSIHTNPKERQFLYDFVCGKDSLLLQITNCEKINQKDFYKLVSESRFVLSPHGNGLDCFRTYETLYLGSYPIVKTSSLDELYIGLPVLIVNEWADLTVELLQNTFDEFQNIKFNYRGLYGDFWLKKFKEMEF